MELKKSLLALSIVSALTACSGSDSTKTENNNTLSTTPTQINFSGVASKGTLINAPISLYKFDGEQFVAFSSDEINDTDIKTNELGQFDLKINNYTGPVKAVIKVDHDTKMLCDATVSCGEYSYLETFDLSKVDPNFTLESTFFINEDIDNISITPLTHLSSKAIEASGDFSQANIALQHAKVHQAFSVDNSLVQPIQLLDITTIESLQGVNQQQLEYALINSGFANAIFEGEDTAYAVMSTKLNEASNHLLAQQGEIFTSNEEQNSFSFTIDNVYSGAAETAKQLESALENNEEIKSKLKKLNTSLENEALVLKANAESGVVSALVLANSTNDNIQKAQNLVSDVRVFSNLLSNTNGEKDELKAQADEFKVLLENASDGLSKDLESFSLLTDTVNAIRVINQQINEGQTKATQFNIADYSDDANLLGSVYFDKSTKVFQANISRLGTVIQLNSVIQPYPAGNKSKLSINGNIASPLHTIKLNVGSYVEIDLEEGTDLFAGDKVSQALIESGALNLDVTLEQRTPSADGQRFSFNGQLLSKLERGYKVKGTPETVDENGSNHVINNLSVFLIPSQLQLSGSFSNNVATHLEASTTISVHNAKDYMVRSNNLGLEYSKDGATVATSNGLNVVELSIGEHKKRYTLNELKQPGNWTATIEKISPYRHEIQILKSTTEENATSEPTRVLSQTIQNTDGQVSDITIIKLIPLDYNNNGSIDTYTLMHSYEGYNMETGELLVNYEGHPSYFRNIVGLNKNKLFRKNADHTPVKFDALTVNSAVDLIDEGFINSSYYETFFVDLQGLKLKPNTSEQRDAYKYITSLPKAIEFNVSEDKNTITSKVLDSSISNILTFKRHSPTQYTVTYNVGSVEPYKSISVYGADLKSQRFNYAQSDSGQISLSVYNEGTLEPDTHSSFDIIPIDDNQDGKIDHYATEQRSSYSTWVEKNEFPTLGAALDFCEYSGFSFDCRTAMNSNNAADLLPSLIQRNSSLYTVYDENYGQFFVHPPVNVSFSEQSEVRFDLAPIYLVDAPTFDSPQKYLDITAAINVGLKIKDYDVSMTLSGERTGFKEGEYSLDLDYQLPDNKTARKLSINYDDVNKIAYAENHEGVQLSLYQVAKTIDGQIVKGVVNVNNIEVAKIIERDGLILIAYTDGQIESL